MVGLPLLALYFYKSRGLERPRRFNSCAVKNVRVCHGNCDFYTQIRRFLNFQGKDSSVKSA